MEKLSEKILPNRRALQHPPLFRSPCKLNPIKLESRTDRFYMVPNSITLSRNKEIVQAIKRSVLQYRSIFTESRFLLDEPQSRQTITAKETNETQHSPSQIDRKGYHFYQYSANNPIEDSICHFEIDQLDAFVVSVFDGHGGQQLSKFCAQNTQQYLQQWIKHSIKLQKYQTNKLQLIKDGLRQLHFELENQFYKKYIKIIMDDNCNGMSKKCGKKIKSVGTCAITAVLYDNKVIVANCGDSQCMVISQDRGSFNYEKLSERFSVSSKAQRQRLAQQFKQIDENIVVEERKNVYYLKGMLQPTKSIGDFYLKHKQHQWGEGQFKGPYLSCQPDVRVYEIKEHDKHIVVASDGLWDYLSKWQIVKYVYECKTHKANIAERETESETQDENQPGALPAAMFLAEIILQKVSNQFDFDTNYVKSLQLGERRSYHDDITIAIIDIDQFFDKKSNKL